MTTTPAVTLSADRLTLTITIREATADRVLTLGRPASEPFTDADVTDALRMAAAAPHRAVLPGQVNTTRRWHVGPGWLYVHIMSGPPTWWAPRLLIHERALVAGWLRRCWVLAWRPGR